MPFDGMLYAGKGEIDIVHTHLKKIYQIVILKYQAISLNLKI